MRNNVMKRESSAMVLSWDSIFVQSRLITEIFRVKERDYISTLCLI